MKVFWWGLAAICIFLGVLTVWMPIPTGVPLMALGVILIIATSRGAARHLRNRRKSFRKLNDAFTWLEDRAPETLARILRRTRPRNPR